jgi:PKD repeat protein
LFYVYARQFANFTATPTTGKVPLAVTFTDTSDATPIQWYWDLGDGTNSTEQNPSHMYTTAGTYNVSLKAWNDLGSDAMEKTGYITVSNPAPPVANFTATPTPGNVPLNATFNVTSTNTPENGSMTGDDDAYAAVQQPAHIYPAAGSTTVSLNVTPGDAANATLEDSVAAVNPSPTMTPTPPPITTATIANASPPTRDIPEWQRRYMPPSPVAAVSGVALAGLLYMLRKKNNR